jgi:1D-myo-inositol-tetrakisphosphate 5-kinase/inositol-polyphosphate multikinase
MEEIGLKHYSRYSLDKSSRGVDLNVYNYQVAGHFNQIILSDKDKLFKPCIKLNFFKRELNIYEKIHNCEVTNSVESASFLKQFVPKYYGIYISSSNIYLVLENMTYLFNKPSICDVKVGLQTFEPSSTLAKIDSQRNKYKFQEIIGFRFSAFKVYDVDKKIFKDYDKSYCRSLTPDSIIDGLTSYLFNGIYYRLDVVKDFIQQLEKLYLWLQIQKDYHFYSASLLLIYEGDVLDSSLRFSMFNSNHLMIRNSVPRPIVRLIDFAHTVENPGSIDINYLQGLEKLLETFYELNKRLSR